MITPQQAQQILTKLRKPLRLHDGFDKSVAEAFEYVTDWDLKPLGLTWRDLDRDVPSYLGTESVAIGGGRHITGHVFERGGLEVYAGLSMRGVGI